MVKKIRIRQNTKLENHETITINRKNIEENTKINNNKQLTTQGTQWV